MGPWNAPKYKGLAWELGEHCACQSGVRRTREFRASIWTDHSQSQDEAVNAINALANRGDESAIQTHTSRYSRDLEHSVTSWVWVNTWFYHSGDPPKEKKIDMDGSQGKRWSLTITVLQRFERNHNLIPCSLGESDDIIRPIGVVILGAKFLGVQK